MAALTKRDDAEAIPRTIVQRPEQAQPQQAQPAPQLVVQRPEACGYLDSLGLPTGKYWNPDPGLTRHRCVSDYRRLTERDGRENLMTYWAEGDEHGAIDTFTLSLSVSVRPAEEQARKELGTAADLLCGRVFGGRLPTAAQKAILGGESIKMTKDTTTITIRAPTGRPGSDTT